MGIAADIILATSEHWRVVLAGVALSLALYLRRTMRPHVAYLARHADGALVEFDQPLIVLEPA